MASAAGTELPSLLHKKMEIMNHILSIRVKVASSVIFFNETHSHQLNKNESVLEANKYNSSDEVLCFFIP